ncbi:hypothetical protein EYC84_006978 [Monilinia fructicola]|uniref:Uncharacterized protein n=1 Tax=Monilinia fructicola TaxID=38448 RepID=A0A5M9KDB4_MONFR|nr:hypothetical protein EYC84_006978 [Monilinia fructicola]
MIPDSQSRPKRVDADVFLRRSFILFCLFPLSFGDVTSFSGFLQVVFYLCSLSYNRLSHLHLSVIHIFYTTKEDRHIHRPSLLYLYLYTHSPASIFNICIRYISISSCSFDHTFFFPGRPSAILLLYNFSTFNTLLVEQGPNPSTPNYKDTSIYIGNIIPS